MLVETVQYYDENGRQPVYVLQLDASKAFDRVFYSRLFNVLLDKKCLSLHRKTPLLHVLKSELLCEME